MFAVPPSDYLGIEDPYMRFAVDFACVCAHMEDENAAMSNSKETSNNEVSDIGRVLDKYKQQITER